MAKCFTVLEKTYIRVISYQDSYIKLITKIGEILHLGVEHEKAITSCHPPGGSGVMFGALKFPHAGAEELNGDPSKSAPLESK